MKGLLVNLVLGGLIAMLLFGVVRRLPRTWWIWGSIVSILFVMFTVLIAPVYIFPIFNKITRIDDPRITGPILSLAGPTASQPTMCTRSTRPARPPA